jgi:transcriptional regulator with XRE-family HTH domain
MKEQLRKSEYIFAERTELHKQDLLIPKEFLTLDFPDPPRGGWLKACREALQITQNELAEKLNISRPAYTKLEMHEVDKTISVASLQKAAEEMDCEMVYFIRPKNKKTFSTISWEKVLPKALQTHKIRTRSNTIKPFVLGNIAARLFRDPKFRREMKWARNSKSVS